MVLVDSSVWIAHLRVADVHLARLLEEGLVRTHSWVIGELACGTLHRRREFLESMERLPLTPMATSREMHILVERQRLFGLGLGWVDIGLLASARLSGARVWTRDRALRQASRALGVAYARA